MKDFWCMKNWKIECGIKEILLRFRVVNTMKCEWRIQFAWNEWNSVQSLTCTHVYAHRFFVGLFGMMQSVTDENCQINNIISTAAMMKLYTVMTLLIIEMHLTVIQLKRWNANHNSLEANILFNIHQKGASNFLHRI